MTDTIAIDFGTMRTKLAYRDPNRNTLELMRLGQDERPFVPSLFFLGEDGRRLFGDDAAEYLDSDPLAFLPRPLKRELREQCVRAGNRVKATPTELLSLLLVGLRKRTSEIACFRDAPPTGLVLTVPAQYGPPDRDILTAAARNAGFHDECITFIDEPIAAAQAWLAELGGKEEYVVVLDCGGGTLDWACLHRTETGKFEMMPDLPASGDNRVGGFDIDEALFAFVDDVITDEGTRAELQTNRCYIRDQIRALKEKHSRTGSGGKLRVGNAPIEIPAEDIDAIIARRFISQACQNLCSYLDKVRDKLKIEKPTVLLVGGSARLRGFKEAVEQQGRCNAVWWERSEYATVLGALPVLSPPHSGTEKPTTALPPEPTAPPTTKRPESTVNDSLAQAQYAEAANAMQSGNADAAIQKLTLCLMLSPTLSEARELLVDAFAAKNDLQSAMISAKAWTDVSPENQRAWAALGSVAFAGGDFATAALVLGRNISSLDADGLLRLAASLFRQGKTTDASGVLERMKASGDDPIVRTLILFLLAWLKRGSAYTEADLRNYTEALAGWRSLTDQRSDAMISMLAWFGISLPDFSVATQTEMLSALLNLKRGNHRDAVDAFVLQCSGRVDFGVVWSSSDPDSLGCILANALCGRRKINKATALVIEMCGRNPAFDIRLVQREKAFHKYINDSRVSWLFKPVLLVTENHGKFLNDITVTNVSVYKVTNVKVTVRVIRTGGKPDTPFTVSFVEIAPQSAQTRSEVFKNAGWFGGGVERVDTDVTCDQDFKMRKLPPVLPPPLPGKLKPRH